MGILDWVFAGKVLTWSPLILDEAVLLTNRRQAYFLLVERWGERRLVLKELEKSLGVPCGVSYSVVRGVALPALRESYPGLDRWFDLVEELTGAAGVRSELGSDDARPSAVNSPSSAPSVALSLGDQVWNRAAIDAGGERPGPGDSALAALLLVHDPVMECGVHRALATVSAVELSAAAEGYAYFGLSGVAAFLRGSSEDPVLSEWTKSTEVIANRRYAQMVPDDNHLAHLFERKLVECPEQFAPIRDGNEAD
jgi:hypothetical protein